jgi:hypothetical protein
MSIVVEGVVRGGKIVLLDGPELADGQRVQVVIEPPPVPIEPAPAAVGATADEGTVHTPLEDPALIELLARIRRDHLPLPPSPSGPGRKSAAGILADDPTWDEHFQDVLESRKSAASDPTISGSASLAAGYVASQFRFGPSRTRAT